MLMSPGLSSFLMVAAPVAVLLVLLAVVLPLVWPGHRRIRHPHDGDAVHDDTAAPDEPRSRDPRNHQG